MPGADSHVRHRIPRAFPVRCSIGRGRVRIRGSGAARAPFLGAAGLSPCSPPPDAPGASGTFPPWREREKASPGSARDRRAKPRQPRRGAAAGGGGREPASRRAGGGISPHRARRRASRRRAHRHDRLSLRLRPRVLRHRGAGLRGPAALAPFRDPRRGELPLPRRGRASISRTRGGVRWRRWGPAPRHHRARRPRDHGRDPLRDAERLDLLRYPAHDRVRERRGARVRALAVVVHGRGRSGGARDSTISSSARCRTRSPGTGSGSPA